MYKFAYITVLLLFYLLLPIEGFGLGSHCRNYPFARRCLGVAAKRSISKTDIYSALIQKALEGTRQNLGTENSDSISDTRASTDSLSKIISALLAHDSSDVYPESQQAWEATFEDYDTNRRAVQR